jgi:hypothetical protein
MSAKENEYVDLRIHQTAQREARVGTEDVWARNPRVLETEMGDDISLYDPVGERVTVLNTTASDIWRLLDGTVTVTEVTDLLARAYQTDPSRIAPDVRTTVERLADEELLTRKE